MPKRLRVLIVEDQPGIAELMREMLILEGHTIVGVSEGSDVIQLVEALRPDVVTLDLNLPDVDGRDLLREITAGESAPSVVVISAYLERLTAEERALAADVVPKPFNVSRLIEAVHRAGSRVEG